MTELAQGIEYQPRGLTPSSGGDGAEWKPLPEGRYPMIIENVRVMAPSGAPRLGRDGKPMKQNERVLFTCSVLEEVAAKVRARAKLTNGEQQSTTVWYSASFTWGWLRDAQLNTTKLFDFCSTVAGLPAKRDMRQWLQAGGVLDPDWFKGMQFRGTVEHNPKQTGDGVWVNVTPATMESEEATNRATLVGRLEQQNPQLFRSLLDNPIDDDDESEDVEEGLF